MAVSRQPELNWVVHLRLATFPLQNTFQVCMSSTRWMSWRSPPKPPCLLSAEPRWHQARGMGGWGWDDEGARVSALGYTMTTASTQNHHQHSSPLRLWTPLRELPIFRRPISEQQHKSDRNDTPALASSSSQAQHRKTRPRCD